MISRSTHLILYQKNRKERGDLFGVAFKCEMNYTYILECSDGSLYTGWTNDIEKRLKAHNAGLGAKYTKPRRPVTLVYKEEFETKEEAMRREYAIKQLTREEKLKLIGDKKQSNLE